jgi:hypothetical protein
MGKQLREKIIERIREGADAASTNRQIIVIRKLKNGDLAIYINSMMTKKEIKTTVDWANRITLDAVIKKRIWPVLIHGVRVIDYPQKAEEKHARRIKKENEKFHLKLKILRIRWLGRIEEIKNYAFLIVKVPCAE